MILGAAMQLGTPELILILVLVIVLFGFGRVGKIAGELGQGLRAFRRGVKGPEQPPVEQPEEVAEQSEDSVLPPLQATEANLATIGGNVSGVLIMGSGNQTTINQINQLDNLDKLFSNINPSIDEPITIYLSSTQAQNSERQAVVNAFCRLKWIGITKPGFFYFLPSPIRTEKQVNEELQASDFFLLIAHLPLDAAQLKEHRQALGVSMLGRFYFVPSDEIESASLALGEPIEALVGYEDPILLSDLIYKCLIEGLVKSARANKLSRADLTLLLGLAGTLELEGGWLAEIRAWLDVQPAAGSPLEAKAAPVPEAGLAEQPVERPPTQPEKTPPRARGKYEPEMVHVPAGEFWMGSQDGDAEAWEDEKPQHKVYLGEYWIGRYPVTVAEFRVFVEWTGHLTRQEKEHSEWTWRAPRGKGSDTRGKDDHPVIGVAFHDALAYCCWLSGVTGSHYTLPSEAEWEKAARGTDGRKYPWGDSPPDRSRCNIEGWFGDTTPVGKFSPGGDAPRFDNRFGCADMAGNVWEWTRSLWGTDWEKPDWKYSYDPKDRKREDLRAGDEVRRVLRGGSWYFNGRNARCASRIQELPGRRAQPRWVSGGGPPFFHSVL